MAIELVLDIVNAKGLHARASAKFVETVERFQSDVRVSRDGLVVGGTSIMGLLMLAAGKGSQITVEVEGPDETEAAAAVATLVSGRFGEDS
jgi:phosphocarrier protein